MSRMRSVRVPGDSERRWSGRSNVGAGPTVTSEQFGATRVIALALVSTSAWLSITLLPYEVSTLSEGHHAGTAGAGWIAAAELACARLRSKLRGSRSSFATSGGSPFGAWQLQLWRRSVAC